MKNVHIYIVELVVLVPVPIIGDEKWRPLLTECAFNTWLPSNETRPENLGRLYVERPILRLWKLDTLRCVVLFVPMVGITVLYNGNPR